MDMQSRFTAQKIAYITAGDELLILDITDISSPQLLSSFNKTTTARNIAFDGDLLRTHKFKKFQLVKYFKSLLSPSI